jgi:exodeoxyribonuclease VII small subunit
MSKKKEEPRFEDLVTRVEDALHQLESGDLPLEDALKRYEEGVAALRQCFGILKQAEKKVQQLSERDGELQAAPFDADEEDPGAKAKLF